MNKKGPVCCKYIEKYLGIHITKDEELKMRGFRRLQAWIPRSLFERIKKLSKADFGNNGVTRWIVEHLQKTT